MTCFNIFSDSRIGLNSFQLPSLPMDVDEDCETTESVKNKGTKICIQDLRDSLKIPRERTETQSSYTSYEDC